MTAFEDRNIVLTGFMGTGKSTIGRRLAKRLGFGWVDTDHVIEERHGPIPEIFARAGEFVFRGIERNIASELSTRTRLVVSTGGRMLLDPDNIRAFSASGRIFCLSVEPDVLVSRLRRSPTPRPLLSGDGDPDSKIRTLLAERQAGYGRFTQVRSGVESADEVTVGLAALITTPTETASGRRGHAVLGDATTGLPHPVVVVSDENVAELHGPCLGPVDRVVTDGSIPEDTGSVIFLGGRSVTNRLSAFGGVRRVVVPTTQAAMDSEYPNARVVIDLATLQTVPKEAQ
ncbi:MAG: shikimate kinase [Acidimicrobiia bacterium]